MSSSKLDYLSKYMDGRNKNNNDNDDDSDDYRKSKKKKKDKKKTQKKSRKDDDNNRWRIQDEDNDDAWQDGAFHKDGKDNNDDKDEEQEEDDGPVVVNEDEQGGVTTVKQQRGQWETVDDDNHNHNGLSIQTATTRQRYDSSSGEERDEEPQRIKRQRYDSSDGEEEDTKPKQPPARRSRYDSDDEPPRNPPIKTESSRDSSFAKGRVKREDVETKRRHDSSSDDDDQRHGNARKQKRYDSSDDDDAKDGGTKRMSSGHKAGMQTGQTFAQAEAEIQKKRKDEAQEMVDRYGMGETVHRGKSSKKGSKGQPLTAAQQAEINQGKYQKEKAAREREQFARIQQSEFARRVDDDEIESLRKQTLREGDPMAQYAQKKSSSSKKSKGQQRGPAQSTRPVYKGPPARPNRFGIRPGFRWDGNDRGNGFEDRLLAKRSNQRHKQEEAYRWSSANM